MSCRTARLLYSVADYATVGAMADALRSLDHCRLGSADDRAEAYRRANIGRSEIERLDGFAWAAERARRRLYPAAPITHASAGAVRATDVQAAAE